MRIDLWVAGQSRRVAAAFAVASVAAAAGTAGAAGGVQAPDPQPPPLAADPAEVLAAEGGARDDLRRRTSAATAAAPFTHQVLELVNEERLANGGLPPLKGVALLDSSAGGHSSRMATGDFFSHCDLDTQSSPSGRMQAAGYFGNTTGENIAAGQSTPQSVMAAWMASTFHRENILRTTFRELGVGYFQQVGDAANVRVDFDGNCTVDDVSGPFVHYWTQNFGRRTSVFPVVVERETWETSCAGVDLYTYGAGTFSQMRFSNDGATWSPWMAFSAEAEWTLPPGASGTATVWAELGNGGGPLHQATDTIGIADDYPAAAELDLSAQTVTTTESFTACDTITAGDGFHVAGGGDATFTARSIVLTDGFSVAAGGTFRAATR
ncbi:MAG TPA: CAP domain-containing protein [Thermoanaerobaculia bacterium]